MSWTHTTIWLVLLSNIFRDLKPENILLDDDGEYLYPSCFSLTWSLFTSRKFVSFFLLTATKPNGRNVPGSNCWKKTLSIPLNLYSNHLGITNFMNVGSNLWMLSLGHIRISDLGLAVTLPKDGQAHGRVGTIGYMGMYLLYWFILYRLFFVECKLDYVTFMYNVHMFVQVMLSWVMLPEVMSFYKKIMQSKSLVITLHVVITLLIVLFFQHLR